MLATQRDRSIISKGSIVCEGCFLYQAKDFFCLIRSTEEPYPSFGGDVLLLFGMKHELVSESEARKEGTPILRKHCSDKRTLSWCAHNLQPSSQASQALTHRLQTQVSGERLPWLEAYSIIADLQDDSCRSIIFT